MRLVATFAAGALLSTSANAQEVYGPPITEAAVPKPSINPTPDPTAKERRCVKRWRTINYAGQAADVASTIVVMENGGEELNPVARALFGKNLKVHEMLLMKAGTMIPFHFFTKSLERGGNYKASCTAHKVFGVLAWTVAGLNMRFAF